MLTGFHFDKPLCSLLLGEDLNRGVTSLDYNMKVVPGHAADDTDYREAFVGK